MGLGEISLGEMGLGEMGQNRPMHVLVDAQHRRSGATGTPPKLGLNRGGVSST